MGGSGVQTPEVQHSPALQSVSISRVRAGEPPAPVVPPLPVLPATAVVPAAPVRPGARRPSSRRCPTHQPRRWFPPRPLSPPIPASGRARCPGRAEHFRRAASSGPRGARTNQIRPGRCFHRCLASPCRHDPRRRCCPRRCPSSLPSRNSNRWSRRAGGRCPSRRRNCDIFRMAIAVVTGITQEPTTVVSPTNARQAATSGGGNEGMRWSFMAVFFLSAVAALAIRSAPSLFRRDRSDARYEMCMNSGLDRWAIADFVSDSAHADVATVPPFTRACDARDSGLTRESDRAVVELHSRAVFVRTSLIATACVWLCGIAHAARGAPGGAKLPAAWSTWPTSRRASSSTCGTPARTIPRRPARGYGAVRCLLTKEAARAPRGRPAGLAAFGVGLKVYDCYRPQRAVDDFVAWSRAPGPATNRAITRRCQRASYSSGATSRRARAHSRGSTVDLTLMSGGAVADGGRGAVDCRRIEGPRRRTPA